MTKSLSGFINTSSGVGELASIDHKQTWNGSEDYRAEPSSQQSDQAPATNYPHIGPALKQINIDHLSCKWAMRDNLGSQGSIDIKGQTLSFSEQWQEGHPWLVKWVVWDRLLL